MDQIDKNAVRLAVESKFKTLINLTGSVQTLIVSGPPGIGKSYGIEVELKKQGRTPQIVKAGLSPIGLYVKLWETRGDNFTLVIDDSDDILTKREGIDLLKAALDTNEPRRVQWNKQNKNLEDMGIPNQFEYAGQIIFLTNLDLKHGNSKARQRDYDTIVSRAFYLDLEMNNLDAKLMRCQIGLEEGMLSELLLSDRGILFEYLTKYGPYFSEVSLRTLTKLAYAMTSFPNWEMISATTLMDDPPPDAYKPFVAEGTGQALIVASIQFPGTALQREQKSEEITPTTVEIFGEKITVPKSEIERIDAQHERTIRCLEVIDDFFLNMRFIDRQKLINRDDDDDKFEITDDYITSVFEACGYKKNLGLKDAEARELYAFILQILPVLGEIDESTLWKMVKFFKIAGTNWKQGLLGMFAQDGVSVGVQRKS